MSAPVAKEKATYYLSPAVLEALNEALFSLKKDVAKKQRKDFAVLPALSPQLLTHLKGASARTQTTNVG